MLHTLSDNDKGEFGIQRKKDMEYKGGNNVNRFEKSLRRIEKGVIPDNSWTEDDVDHYKTVVEALKRCADEEKCVDLGSKSCYN